MFYPQGNFYSQGSFGYPQGSFGQQGFQGASSGIQNGIPFANTLYGYPQLTPSFAQGVPQISSWQHPAQQQAQLQALQQQAMLQLLAPQLTAQPFAFQHPTGTSALNGFANGGLANGAAQSVGGWQQPQVNPEQINPALSQQSQLHLLQRLAQYHYLVAQQFIQLAAQQAAQYSANPYTGQFIPGQLGANFVPGVTMH
jgi:hypothetical protein